jgi:hypothetical protein
MVTSKFISLTDMATFIGKHLLVTIERIFFMNDKISHGQNMNERKAADVNDPIAAIGVVPKHDLLT